MARQLQFDDQICRLCPAGDKETTAHALGGGCALHAPGDLAAGVGVRDLIRAKATAHTEYIDHIPLWFPHGGVPDSPFLLPMPEFKALAAYDKLMGGLGYVPSTLRKALRHFNVADQGDLIRSIAVYVARTARDKWQHRCQVMVASNAWKAANTQAAQLVDAGIG
jgi:hypothetical protein